MIVNGIDLEKARLIGTVMTTDSSTKEIGVYIPKLMSGIDGSSEASYKMATNAGLTLPSFSTNVASTVTKSNYYLVKAFDKDDDAPAVGSKVEVIFLDGNVREAFWKKFNPNGDYQSISSGVSDTLMTLTIKNSSKTSDLTIHEGDKVEINIPDYLSISRSDTSTDSIYSFYLQDSLETTITSLSKQVEYLKAHIITEDLAKLDAVDYSGITDSDTLTYVKSFKTSAEEAINSSTDIVAADDETTFGISKIGNLVYAEGIYQTKKTAYAALSETAKTFLTSKNVDVALEYSSIFNAIKNLTDKDQSTTYNSTLEKNYVSSYSITYEYYKSSSTTSTTLVDKVETVASYAAIASTTPSDITESDIIYSEKYAVVKMLGWNNTNDQYAWRSTTLYPQLFGLCIPIDEIKYDNSGKIVAASLIVINDAGYSYDIERTADATATTPTWSTYDAADNATLLSDLNDGVNSTAAYRITESTSGNSYAETLKISDIDV